MNLDLDYITPESEDVKQIISFLETDGYVDELQFKNLGMRVVNSRYASIVRSCFPNGSEIVLEGTFYDFFGNFYYIYNNAICGHEEARALANKRLIEHQEEQNDH